MDKIALNKFSEFLLSLCEKLVKIAAESLYNIDYESVKNNGYTGEDDKKKVIFSMMFMISNDGGESFRWFLTKEQKKWVLSKLNEKFSNVNSISAEEFFETFINFKFYEGGMVSYFKKTGRETEYIVNFKDEKYIIGEGYKKDWESQDKTLEDMKKELPSQIGDPFVYLEEIWAFENVPFFYFDMGSIIDLQIRLYALLPLFSINVSTNNQALSLQERITLFKKIEQIISYGKLFLESFTSLQENIQKDIEEIQSHAIRSAVAAIMIRNFSHHHGSHVLPRIQINNDTNAKDVQQYLLYLQEKTAFLNIINVYDPIPEGKVSIKDAIDFFRNNNGVKLFLKYFAEASEKDNVYVYNNESCENDYCISPGYGELGKHALYVILENFIRNLLKHSQPLPSGNGDLGIFVKYSENGVFIDITISSENYFLINDGVFCNETNASNIIEEIKQIINTEELIHSDGKTNFDYPGLKEMRICANMLMGKNPGLIEKGTLLPVLETHIINDKKYYSISYTFKIPKGRFVLQGNKENIEKLKNGEEVKPDFIVFNMNDENINLAFKNWDLLPQRICWIGNENDFGCPDNWSKWIGWIKKRSIFIQNEEWQNKKVIDEKNQYSFLLKKWYKKIFNEKEIEIKIHHNDLNVYNKNIFAPGSAGNTQKFHFYHSDPPCNCGEDIVKLKFSTNSAYRIVRFLGDNYHQLNSTEDLIIPLEIKSALGFKILIVDEEIFKIYNELLDNKNNLLKELNIEFVSENHLKSDNFQNYDCIVLHLGIFDVNENLYWISPDCLPPYVRIVTGRAKSLPEKILNNCLWANSRLIDRSVFIRAFESEDVFDIKYKIFKECLL